MAKRWIQKAVSQMRRKNTLGSFGTATPSKIAAAKRAGGKRAKKAVFAQNMKRIAQRQKRRSSTR